MMDMKDHHDVFSFSFSILIKSFFYGKVRRMRKAALQISVVIAVLSFSGCHCTMCGGAQAGPLTVLQASQLPEQQGWSVSTNAASPLDVTTNGNHLTLNTIGVSRKDDEKAGKAFMWFYADSPVDLDSNFSIEFPLKVHKTERPHNLYDAGIMFYGSTDTAAGDFARETRRQMIYFDEDAIGWGDESGKFDIETTDTFHTYRLTVDKKGAAKVYVDGTLALQRTDWKGNSGIGFGDMTNDDGVNGKFSIGDIVVTGSKGGLIGPTRKLEK
jgi:hypothetical protein